jgi:hypothetical protein
MLYFIFIYYIMFIFMELLELLVKLNVILIYASPKISNDDIYYATTYTAY